MCNGHDDPNITLTRTDSATTARKRKSSEGCRTIPKKSAGAIARRYQRPKGYADTTASRGEWRGDSSNASTTQRSWDGPWRMSTMGGIRSIDEERPAAIDRWDSACIHTLDWGEFRDLQLSFPRHPLQTLRYRPTMPYRRYY